MPKLSLYTQNQSKIRDWRSELSRQGGSIHPIRAPRDVSARNAAIHTNSVPKSANAPVSGRISSQVPKSQPAKVTVPKINTPSVPRAQGAIHASAPKTGHDTGKISSAVPHAPPAKVSVPSVKMPNVPDVPNAKIQSVSYPISPALLAWRENPQALALIRARMVELANNHANNPDPEDRRVLLSLIDRYARINNDALHSPLSVSEAQRIIARNGQDNWIDRQFSPAFNDLVQRIGTGPGLASTFRQLGYVFGLPAFIASNYATGQGSKGNKSISDALAERAWYAYAPDWIRRAIIPAPLSTIPDQVKSLANFDAQQFEAKMADVLNRITAETRDELGLGINQSGSEQSNVLRSRYLANSGLSKAQAAALVPYVALQRFADPLFNEYLPASVGPVGIDRQYLRNWYTEHVLGSFPPEVINAAAQIGLIGNPARIAPISVPSQGEPPEQQQEPQQQQQNQLQEFEPQKQEDFVIRPSSVPAVPPEEQEEINKGTNTIPIPEIPDKQFEQSGDDVAKAQMANLKKLADDAIKAETDARAEKDRLTTERNKITNGIQSIKGVLAGWKQQGKVSVDVNNPDWDALIKQAETNDILSVALKSIEQYRNDWPTLQANLAETDKKLEENQNAIRDAREKAYYATMRYRYAQLINDASTDPKQQYQELIDNYYKANTDDTIYTISGKRKKIFDEIENNEEKIYENIQKIKRLEADYKNKKTEYDNGYEKHMSNYPAEKLADVNQAESLFGGDDPRVLTHIHDLLYTPQRELRNDIKYNSLLTRGLAGVMYDQRHNTTVQWSARKPYLLDVLRNTGKSPEHDAVYNRAYAIAKNHTFDENGNTLNFDSLLEQLPYVKGVPKGKDIVRIAKNYVEYVNLGEKYRKETQEPKMSPDKANLEALNLKLIGQNDALNAQIAAHDTEYSAAYQAREDNINDATKAINKYEQEYKNTVNTLKPLPQIQGLLQSGLKNVGGGVNLRDVMGNVAGLGSIVVGGGLLGLLNRASDSARDVPPAGYIDLNYRDPAAEPQNQPPVPLPAPNAPDSEFARQMERWIAREYAIRNPEPSLRQRISNVFRGSGEARPSESEDESIPKINDGIVQLDRDNSQSISSSKYAAIGSDDADDRRVNLAKEALEQPHKSKVERNSKLVDASQKVDTGWGIKWIDDAIDYTAKTAKKVGTNTIKGINWTRDHINNLTDWVNDEIQDTINHWRGHNPNPNDGAIEMGIANAEDHINLNNSLRENLIIREEKEEEEDEKEEEIDTHTPKKGRNRKKRN